ncbi:hypothetical protein PanWU01x14_370280, partial [Parasponia andersonii]
GLELVLDPSDDCRRRLEDSIAWYCYSCEYGAAFPIVGVEFINSPGVLLLMITSLFGRRRQFGCPSRFGRRYMDVPIEFGLRCQAGC